MFTQTDYSQYIQYVIQAIDYLLPVLVPFITVVTPFIINFGIWLKSLTETVVAIIPFGDFVPFIIIAIVIIVIGVAVNLKWPEAWRRE